MSVYFPEFDDPQPPRASGWMVVGMIVGVLLLLAIGAKARGAEVKSYRVIDGDTIEATVRLEFGYIPPVQTYRLYGYDAWESRKIRKSLKLTPSQWEAEVIKGKVAKAALEKLLSQAKVIEVREVKALRDDPYGRELIEVYADGKEVGAILRAQGHERK